MVMIVGQQGQRAPAAAHRAGAQPFVVLALLRRVAASPWHVGLDAEFDAGPVRFLHHREQDALVVLLQRASAS